jgi:hypothetical protein
MGHPVRDLPIRSCDRLLVFVVAQSTACRRKALWRMVDDEKMEEVTGHRQAAPHGEGLEQQTTGKGNMDAVHPPSPVAEDFDFDPDEGVEDASPRWFAMARLPPIFQGHV